MGNPDFSLWPEELRLTAAPAWVEWQVGSKSGMKLDWWLTGGLSSSSSGVEADEPEVIGHAPGLREVAEVLEAVDGFAWIALSLKTSSKVARTAMAVAGSLSVTSPWAKYSKVRSQGFPMPHVPPPPRGATLRIRARPTRDRSSAC